ncbi:MAG: exodeoxyribonuclease III [Alphaproteobacteria bacterium]
MKIASWNVNSIKVRLPAVLEWLEDAKPDVLLMQEIKTVDQQFPAEPIEALGYALAVHGQKTYNGVAIASRERIEDVETGLPGDKDDEQARYIEATIGGKLRVASIYLPNGNPAPGEKFDYKLRWLKRLKRHAKKLLDAEEIAVLGGDYNVIPADADVYDPEAWRDDALFRPESRAGLRSVTNLGFVDAFRALHPNARHAYTFWDYQAGAWQRDHGLRIDHLLLSPQAADRLEACEIDRKPRSKPKASDHTPIWCELKL